VEKTKQVLEIHGPLDEHWVGDGFPVRSLLLPQAYEERVSPFLLLDYAGPREFPPTEKPRGVDEHPHRGFETVTILYQGEVEHRDSAGNGGKLGPGDVQWMTAASGVVHEEKHSREFARRGGTFEVVQLWVNLPAEHKMSKPAYQELSSARIPIVSLDGGAGTLRVIAGEFEGTKGAARTFTPVNVWDLRLAAGQRMRAALPEGHNALVAVLQGEGILNGSDSIGGARLALLGREGGSIEIAATRDMTALLLTGRPIEEPLVSYGPFVMNTPDQIRQAIRDYQSGAMGSLST
jgi:quercetin 2,3-dioxygenase